MANAYEQLTDAELDAELARLEAQADETAARGLKLDMARGKPSPEQTALSRPMLDLVSSSTPLVDGDAIVDNYGTPEGLPSARRLAAQILGVDAKNVVVSGSSSLNLMHDLVAHAFVHGVGGCEPLCRQGEVKWLCPSPGYDRHFAVTASFGIKNVPVPMGEDGPDMDLVQDLVEGDPTVKGIWCVPKYANPTGITYSDAVVRRFPLLLGFLLQLLDQRFSFLRQSVLYLLHRRLHLGVDGFALFIALALRHGKRRLAAHLRDEKIHAVRLGFLSVVGCILWSVVLFAHHRFIEQRSGNDARCHQEAIFPPAHIDHPFHLHLAIIGFREALNLSVIL